MSEVVYRKDEVWLAKLYGEYGLVETTILAISGRYIRTDKGWESAADWHARAVQKVGTVRRFCGIRIGVKRD